VSGLALDTGVNGENVPKAFAEFLLLDLRGKAGIADVFKSSSLVLTRSGLTSRDGVARGLSSVAAVGGPRRTSEASNSAIGVLLTGESAPVNCLKAFDGVLSGDSGIRESMSQLALRVRLRRLT
jgi:hypothetical protein